MYHRTSQTHPIQVAWATNLIGQGGRIGLTFAPGKKASSAYGAPWHRDLDADLHRLVAEHGVGVLVSLVEDSELTTLQIPRLVERASALGIAVVRSPIRDTQVPTYAQAVQVARSTAALAQAGHGVVFHCRGGLGRAGTMAACALIALGDAPERAIVRVRAVRPGAIENVLQERFVQAFSAASDP